VVAGISDCDGEPKAMYQGHQCLLNDGEEHCCQESDYQTRAEQSRGSATNVGRVKRSPSPTMPVS